MAKGPSEEVKAAALQVANAIYARYMPEFTTEEIAKWSREKELHEMNGEIKAIASLAKLLIAEFQNTPKPVDQLSGATAHDTAIVRRKSR